MDPVPALRKASGVPVAQKERRMTIGTKSVLFGAHCFFLHPFFIARAWWKLYGFPLDPRLWCAFFLHDIGYIGKPNMDGPEGETHPKLGARIMHALFDRKGSTRWHDLCLYHSRYYSKAAGKPFSKLCVADKLTFVVTPWWLYLPMVMATGEIDEYFRNAQASGKVDYSSPRAWHRSLSAYMMRWVQEHRHSNVDTWTQIRHKPAA